MTSKDIPVKFREIFLSYLDNFAVTEIEDACTHNDLFIAGIIFKPKLEYILQECNDQGVWITKSELLKIGSEYFSDRNEVANFWQTEVTYNPYFNDFEQKRRDLENEEELAAKQQENKKKHPGNGIRVTLATKLNYERLKLLTYTVREFFMETANQNPKDINRLKFHFENEAKAFIDFISKIFLLCTPDEIRKIILQEIESLRSNANLLNDLDNMMLRKLTEKPEEPEPIYDLTDEVKDEPVSPAPLPIKPLGIRTPELEPQTLVVEFKDQNYQITIEDLLDTAEKFKSNFNETMLNNTLGPLLYKMHVHCRNQKRLRDFHIIIKKVFDHYAAIYQPQKPKDQKTDDEKKNDVIYHLFKTLDEKLGNSQQALSQQKIICRIQGADGISVGSVTAPLPGK
ncbi:MAG: hypothetical protein NTX82_01505 [Candidatus Parcubacteria bacterium]|nr:hypothetical protein [Candidatus Parcubacteria bacterium]